MAKMSYKEFMDRKEGKGWKYILLNLFKLLVLIGVVGGTFHFVNTKYPNLLKNIKVPDVAGFFSPLKSYYVSGKAEVYRSGKKEWETHTGSFSLYKGDTVNTSQADITVLTASGSNNLRLSPEAEMTFRDNKDKLIDLRMNSGAVYVESYDQTFKIQTPYGFAKVNKGKILVDLTTDGITKYYCFSGNALVFTNTSGEVSLKGMQKTYVGSNGVVAEVREIDYNYLGKWERWNLAFVLNSNNMGTKPPVYEYLAKNDTSSTQGKSQARTFRLEDPDGTYGGTNPYPKYQGGTETAEDSGNQGGDRVGPPGRFNPGGKDPEADDNGLVHSYDKQQRGEQQKGGESGFWGTGGSKQSGGNGGEEEHFGGGGQEGMGGEKGQPGGGDRPNPSQGQGHGGQNSMGDDEQTSTDAMYYLDNEQRRKRNPNANIPGLSSKKKKKKPQIQENSGPGTSSDSKSEGSVVLKPDK